jgi:hypothetical protein
MLNEDLGYYNNILTLHNIPMSKTDLERLSLLEQTDSHIKEALADIRNTLKEMRAFQQEHEKNDKERHEIALNADKELAKAVSDNYVSKEWLKTV